MAISCVYCGGGHDAPAEVRACWSRHRDASSPTAAPVSSSVATPNDIRRDTAPAPVASQTVGRPTAAPAAAPTASPAAGSLIPVERLAGADALGRGLVVATGTAVPEPWRRAAVVRVDDAVWAQPAAVVAELRDHAAHRRRVVVELATTALPAVEPPFAPHAIDESPVWQLGPRAELVHDQLTHLVFANAIDLRPGAEPWRWWLWQRALALGATPAPSDAVGDIVLPDGTPAWLDGGPLAFLGDDGHIDGIAVVHRIQVEHGTLTPLGTNDLPGSGDTVELADDQRAAVTHDGGAARIIAPAGSGKTRVLTERARHVVQRWRLPAAAVSLVAFNRRAQLEMAERTRDVAGLQVRTLNAIALAIVNGTAPFAPRPRTLRTIDERDVRRIISSLVTTPRRRNADPIAPWIEALGLVRLGLRPPDEVEAFYDGEVDGFAGMYPRYRAELARAGCVDFDEQVHLALEILLSDPAARATAQRACRVLLVDEFQDLTPAHLLLVRLLAGPDGAVFGVGDDDQTIYGYNGADPAWLIEFAQLFPFAGEHPLHTNYRCPPDVVEVVDRLLRHNAVRVPKVIRSGRNAHGAAGWSASASHDPVGATVAAVQRRLAAGDAAHEVAVLTRVNSLLAPVQVALGALGVPVTGGVGAEFVERTSVRSTLAWMRLGLGLWSSTDLGEALRRPSRPLHPNVANWVTEQHDADALDRLADRLTNERDAQRVREFGADIARVRELVTGGGNTGDVVAFVRDAIGLGNAVQTLDISRRGMNRAAQNDDLTALAQLALLHPDIAGFERWLRDALSSTASGGSGGVVLATVHRVKGQEWPAVVVHCADADQFPHRLADDEEEERRLFHVAITRAIDHVDIVSTSDASPFVAELTNEPPAHRPAAATRRRTDARVDTRAESRVARTASRSGDRDPSSAPLSPLATAVFERLRAMRRELAQGKPAYTVFDDATLERIALTQPTTLVELASLRGIGPTKLDQYGAAVLAVVADALDDTPSVTPATD